MKFYFTISILGGILLGLISYNFYYANGISYFSSDPNACINCHIMQPQFDSWQKGSHHAFATCVECHLPHEPISKWLAKAENGFLHSKGFTLQNFPEPIFIRDKNKNVLKDNCLQCHSDFVTEINHSESSNCLHCHNSVGHGESVGIGKYNSINRGLIQ